MSVQDHRVFCPGFGKVTLDNTLCEKPMGKEVCAACFEDPVYGSTMLALTRARRDAIEGATLLVLSRYMRSELEAVGLGNVEVLPPWVNAAKQPEFGGDYVFLGGRLVAHKGVLLGVEAWRASRVEAPLRVAGEGPLEGQMEGVDLLGWLPRDQLVEMLGKAGVVLFPGRWQEPFGLLAVEALGQGTPVIAMSAGGVNEFADAGCALVELGDVHAMAETLRELWGDPIRRKAMGEAGWDLVRQRFCPVKLGERLDGIYESVASG